jgi:uncharacterized surface protein with fasciclin (FAS1) repeats
MNEELHMTRRLLATLGVAVAALIGLTDVAAAAPKPKAPDLLQTAITANAGGQFDTLIAAVQAADLTGALQAKGQRTVFAPTDDAFAALGLTADNIGTLPKSVLVEVLLYHVTPGRKAAAAVLSADSFRMANGERAVIDAGALTIDGAPIVKTDIAASNGIIHVVGAVLTPSILG